MSGSRAGRFSSRSERSTSTAHEAERTADRVEGGDRRAIERELIFGETVETVRALCQSLQLSQRDLAHRLGVSDARVSRIMSGRENLTLRTLADLGWATGVRFEIVAVPLEERDATPAAGDPPAPRWLHGHACLIAERVRRAVGNDD